MKTEVYSWRLSEDLKSNLEREARARKMSLSSILELAARDWLERCAPDILSNQVQLELQESASTCFGVIAGGKRRRAEGARAMLRERLKNRRVS